MLSSHASAICLAISCVGCASPLGTIPEPVATFLLSSDPAHVHTEIADGQIVAWTIPIQESALPRRAARAIQSILPADGEPWVFLGERFTSSDNVFVAERRYSTDPGDGTRWVRVTAEGEVLVRGYPVDPDAVPAPVAARLSDDGTVPTVVQTGGDDRYRIWKNGAVPTIREYDAEGHETSRVVLRLGTILDVR